MKIQSDRDRGKAPVTCVSKLMSKDIHEQEQTADERSHRGSLGTQITKELG